MAPAVKSWCLLVQVAALDADSRGHQHVLASLDLGCDATVQFLTVGFAALHSEALTGAVMEFGVAGRDNDEWNDRQRVGLHENLEQTMLAWGSSAQRCELGARLRQQLQMLHGEHE